MVVLECLTKPDVTQWAGLIEAEYRELPGLNLTRRQIQRIWGLDESACDSVMRSLVTRRILRESDAGTFVACEPGQRKRPKVETLALTDRAASS